MTLGRTCMRFNRSKKSANRHVTGNSGCTVLQYVSNQKAPDSARSWPKGIVCEAKPATGTNEFDCIEPFTAVFNQTETSPGYDRSSRAKMNEHARNSSARQTRNCVVPAAKSHDLTEWRDKLRRTGKVRTRVGRRRYTLIFAVVTHTPTVPQCCTKDSGAERCSESGQAFDVAKEFLLTLALGS